MLHIVVTARPSWARVKSLVREYSARESSKAIKVLLVGPAVSRRYGDISHDIPLHIEKVKFPSLQEDDDFASVAKTSLLGGIDLARFWNANRPDSVLVVADRTETLGVALTASTMQIPLIHLQGGEISGSIDDKIRDANSKLSDLHLTTNEYTKKNLLKLGETEESIRVVGCPSIDLVRQVKSLGTNINKQSSDYGGVGAEFHTNSKYGIIMFHPDTNDDKEMTLAWISKLISMCQKSEPRGINWFWFWPNPDFGTSQISNLLRKAREQNRLKNVRFVINLEPEIFIDLAISSIALVGNSSFGIREASYIGLPVLNLGNRQKWRQRADNVLDISSESTLEELMYAVENHCITGHFESSEIYGDGFSGMRAAIAISEWSPTLKTRAKLNDVV